MKSTARFCFLVFGVACFAQEPPARAPVRVSGAVMAGNLLHKVTPTFPEEATRQGVNGIVVLHAVIGTDGRVKDLYAVSGPEPLRATYLAAVRQWIYKPYLLQDEAVPVETMISVDMQVERVPESSNSLPSLCDASVLPDSCTPDRLVRTEARNIDLWTEEQKRNAEYAEVARSFAE